MSTTLPVVVQGQPVSRSGTEDGRTLLSRPDALPTAPIPFDRRPQRILLGQSAEDDTWLPGDIPSEAQILRRISRIYGYQSQILAAEAEGDAELAEDLLELAMTELSTLMQQPDVMERPRFRELYRTVITEYERYYDASVDTLTLQFGEIYQFRADMFIALNDLDEPLLEDVALPTLRQPVATTVPMTMNRLVEQSIAYLLRSPDKHLYHWLSRAQTYFPMVEQILREEGVPDELKYLAMIESGLNPRARSWAQAAGMWQFISATGRAYDLDVNSWVDERLDPEKATRAAARHLRDLYEHFDGDWQLALAGYNCSPARIKRAIARAEARLGRRATFWDIYDDIPRETRNYVPMFIAAALVASNPTAFDVDLARVAPGPTYAYHYVPVHGMLDLEDVADLAGTDVNTIRALNPELRRGNVPPSNGPYYIRLPLGTYDRFAEGYATLPKEVRSATVEYKVRSGDSLGKIAKRYGVTVSGLMRTNDLHSTTIHVGQRLIVPVPSYDSAPILADLGDAKAYTVEYGDAAIRPIAVAEATRPQIASAGRPSVPVVRTSTAAAPARAEREEARPARTEAEASADTRIVYRVRRGDNLTEIARKYGVSISDLRQWNNLRSSRIMVGQRLYLYASNGSEASSSRSAEASRTVYRVRRGDTLSEIARKHGVSISDLRRWNDLRSNTIRSGQRLTIYGGSSESQGTAVTYRVRRGDTLSEIARRHGVSVDQIMKWNKLRSSRIRSGQRLTIFT